MISSDVRSSELPHKNKNFWLNIHELIYINIKIGRLNLKVKWTMMLIIHFLAFNFIWKFPLAKCFD